MNLDSEDISVLRDAAETEQSYVIRIAERDAFLVGSTDQGALYAAAYADSIVGISFRPLGIG